MAPNDRTATNKIEPITVKDVTKQCISVLGATPFARSSEGSGILPGGVADKLIPQAEDKLFLKLYVTQPIIKDGKLEITSGEFFPNYICRIFEFTADGKTQLVLVGMSNEFDIGFFNGQTFPFFVHIPPSPQDTPAAHQKRFPQLYAKTAPDAIPTFFKDQTGYPYTWDYLFFQFYLNTFRLAYQFKRAGKPFVFVVPMIKSFSDGLGALNKADILERVLLGIQRLYQDEVLGADSYLLQDLSHVTMCAFSIGNSILSTFIGSNLNTRFLRDVVKSFVILDPPPNNPNNRSPIVDVVLRTMATMQKNLFLYTEDSFYVQPIIRNLLTPKGISFDVSSSKILEDSRVPNVFIAFLQEKLFQASIQDPVLKDVHNTFPNFFICNAAQRSSLKFVNQNGKLHPALSFLAWAPGDP